MAVGTLTIRVNHEITTCRIGRLNDVCECDNVFNIQEAGVSKPFSGIRVLRHQSMFQDWVVQVEISAAYIAEAYVNGCEVSARWDDLNPTEHGTSAAILCAQPVDFVPAD